MEVGARRGGRLGSPCGSPTTVRASPPRTCPTSSSATSRSDRVPARKLGVGARASPSWPSWPRPWAPWSTPSRRSSGGRGARMVLWLRQPPARPTGTTRTAPAAPTVGADAGAPPTPPCVGEAPAASAPVAALRLPAVEPQPRRSPGLGIGRLRTRRHGPHVSVGDRGRLAPSRPRPAAGAGRAGGARRSTRRSRLRGRSTRARTTEPRYRTMKPDHRHQPQVRSRTGRGQRRRGRAGAGVVAAVVAPWWRPWWPPWWRPWWRGGRRPAVVRWRSPARPWPPSAPSATMPVAALLFGYGRAGQVEGAARHDQRQRDGRVDREADGAARWR